LIASTKIENNRIRERYERTKDLCRAKEGDVERGKEVWVGLVRVRRGVVGSRTYEEV